MSIGMSWLGSRGVGGGVSGVGGKGRGEDRLQEVVERPAERLDAQVPGADRADSARRGDRARDQNRQEGGDPHEVESCQTTLCLEQIDAPRHQLGDASDHREFFKRRRAAIAPTPAATKTAAIGCCFTVSHVAE